MLRADRQNATLVTLVFARDVQQAQKFRRRLRTRFVTPRRIEFRYVGRWEQLLSWRVRECDRDAVRVVTLPDTSDVDRCLNTPASCRMLAVWLPESWNNANYTPRFYHEAALRGLTLETVE